MQNAPREYPGAFFKGKSFQPETLYYHHHNANDIGRSWTFRGSILARKSALQGPSGIRFRRPASVEIQSKLEQNLLELNMDLTGIDRI